VTFEEYFTGAFGTTEYQADMTGITLGVDEETMQFSYHGKKIVKENALRTYATIPDVMTTVELGGDNDTALSEEGIAFSPVYHLALRKTIQKGDVNTWLKLQKAN
jgi:hypothetical protein